MVIDVSHLNGRGFWDVADLADGPVIASHSNCRAVCDVPRNLTDDQLRRIRDTGGVAGLNAFHGFVTPTAPGRRRGPWPSTPPYGGGDGAGARGLGFDFCFFMGPGNEGAAGLEDAAGVPGFFRCLEELGMSERELAGIARENLLRVLRRVLG